MADEVDWLPVLQKVFKDYGTQLRRSKVKKFAAKVARQQGRTEDKKELQSHFKAFLKSDKGRNSVVEKDDVLSLGSSEAAGPSQPRLSLFDLAEAAASLSKKQPTRMQPKRPSAKPKPQDNPLAVAKGPRSIRKRKTSSSPDEAASLLPASAAGMQTRGRTRRQSLDSPPEGPSSSPVLPGSAALPSRSRAAKQAADAGLADIPVQGGLDAQTHNAMLVEAGATPSSKAGTDRDQLDKAPDQQPAASDDVLYASPATTSDSPAETPSPPEAPAAMLSDTDQERGPSRHEHTAPDPHAILVKQEVNHGEQTAAATGSLQGTAAGFHDQAEVERSDGGPIKSAVKAKKRKHKKDEEDCQLPSSAAPPPESDAALPETASAPVLAGEPAVKPKKHKRKLNADDSSQPAMLPEEESNEPGASQLQQEADKPAAQPLVVKAKKQKRRHSKPSPSDADVQAAESPAGTMVAADAPAEAAAVASQMVQEPIQAVSQDATTEPEQMKEKKKKKKKKRQIKDAVTGSQPDLAENAAVPAAAVVQHQPELLVTEEPSVQPDSAQPADKLKKKKKKKNKRHSDADVDAQQPAAVSAAAVEPEVTSAQAEPAQAAQEPAVKPKKKKKTKHRQDASVEPRPAGNTAVDTTAAAAAVESAPETGLDQADVAASAAAEVKPKKRKHKDSASKSKLPSAANDDQIDAIETGAPHAEAQEPEPPAVKPKRKRKSKVDATAAAEVAAAEAPSDAPAAAAAAKTPKAKKATAALAKESSCSTLPVLNSWRANQARTDVKKGKFTKQEKDTLKQAAQTYAQDNGLPSDDFSWLLNKARTSGNRKDVNGAWQTIAQSLPHRTYKSVYACGSRMLSELNYQGKWSKEEDEQLRQLVREKGSKWKEISKSLERFPEGCRDRWRELKLGASRQSGRWSEEETTKLRSLVSEYLARKQEIEEKTQAGDALTLTMDDLESSPADTDSKPSDGRIILDDIDWDVISSQHGTRAAPQCLTKWYTQLAPSMVSKGEWGSGDDRRLLRALAKTGATHDFQVDWGQLVALRSAMQARRRWRLMLKCVKDSTDREFHENLHTLLETFTPDLLVAAAGVEAAHDPEAVDDLS